MNRVVLTAIGADRLRGELRRLKTEERPRVIEALAEARSHGDLSENAEYDAARQQQAFIEGRIAELEGQLARAEVIDPNTLRVQGRVVFGLHVDLCDLTTGEDVTYQIVGELEADIGQGQVSVGSPIARALIGREEGDEVEVETPGGTRRYEVVSVRLG